MTSQDHVAREPDYRFTLANERTFLAYLRTALALDAAGLAAAQFLQDVTPSWVPRLAGLVLVLAGLGASVGAWHRWRANLQAMRQGAPLPRTRLPVGLAAAVLIVSFVAIWLALT